MAYYTVEFGYDEERQEATYKTYLQYRSSGIDAHLNTYSSLEDAVRDIIAGDNSTPEITFKGFKDTAKHLDLSV